MKDIKTTDRSDDALTFQMGSQTAKEHMNKLESFGIDVSGFGVNCTSAANTTKNWSFDKEFNK